MKSNRILPVILLVMIVVFVALAGWLYSANSSAVKQNDDLTANVNKYQQTLSQRLATKATLEKDATTLASELAAAQTALAQEKADFRSSAESIQYDGILFSMAADNQLQITDLSATAPADTKENNTDFQITTFTVKVEGLIPNVIFTKPADSAAYIATTVNNIMAFTNEIAHSADFDSAAIPSIGIKEPQPMTDTDIANLTDSITKAVQAGLTADQIQGLTDDQVNALVKSNVAALKPPEVHTLIGQSGIISKVSATITIQVWTYKGA